MKVGACGRVLSSARYGCSGAKSVAVGRPVFQFNSSLESFREWTGVVFLIGLLVYIASFFVKGDESTAKA